MLSSNDFNRVQETAKSITEKLGLTFAEIEAENSPPNSLETIDQKKERCKQAALDQISQFQNKSIRALEIFFAELESVNTSEDQELLHEMSKGMNTFINLSTKLNFENEIKPNQTLQKVLGFNDNLMKRFHEIGIHCLTGAHYEDAVSIFTLMSVLNTYVPNTWLCLGISLYNCNLWEEAITALTISHELDSSNPSSTLYLAFCYHALHDKAKALYAYVKTIEKAGDNENFRIVKEQALKEKKEIE